ncbi:ABC transporter ATP-binding protein [Candidatus Poribacteria bacterium]
MILKETLPETVERAFQKTSENSEIRVSIVSDVGGDGRFGEQWLLATDSDVMVFSPNGTEALLSKTFPLEDLSEVKTHSLIGGSALEATTSSGSLVEILQYSNIHATKFAAAAKWLNQMAKGEEPSPVTDEPPARCPKCEMLLQEGSKVCPRCVQRGKVIVRLMSYLRPHWYIAIAIVVLMLLSNGLSLVHPQLMRILVDEILNIDVIRTSGPRYDLLGWIVLTFAGLNILSIGIRILLGRTRAWLGSRITYDIRGQLYGMVQRMSLRFFDKHKTGELMSRVGRDTGALQGLLAFEMPLFARNFFMLLGIGAFLLVMNWKLALLTLIPMPLVAIATSTVWKRIRNMFRKVWHRWSQLSAVLNDTLSGIRVVKGFAQESRELERFSTRSYDLFHADMKAEQMWATVMPILSFLWGTGTLVIWYFGGRDVLGQRMTLGTFFAFQAYMMMFYGPLEMVTQMWNWITRALAAAERIFEILDTEPEVPDEAEVVPMPEIKGTVEFQNMTFGYDKHKPVLHNIDLNVEAGEMIGFVGHSGAGKTTMTNLICRFYTANEGCILIDGVDIKNIKLDDLRKQIGIVLQEPFLFNGSIAENIGYAKHGVTREEIMQAAKIANAHDFIVKFPDGYDTNAGERGQNLSGGERQRISIARAVLHNPRILILDEATSSVDTETEKKIQEALARLVKGRTTFAIAHRLSTLRNSDRLMVLDKGKCAEVGTHDELMEKKGIYYKLVELQSEMSRIKAVDG